MDVRRLYSLVVLGDELSWKYFGSREGSFPRFLRRLLLTGCCRSMQLVSKVRIVTGVQNGSLHFLSNYTSKMASISRLKCFATFSTISGSFSG